MTPWCSSGPTITSRSYRAVCPRHPCLDTSQLISMSILDKRKPDGPAILDIENDRRPIKRDRLERPLVQRPNTHRLLSTGRRIQPSVLHHHLNLWSLISLVLARVRLERLNSHFRRRRGARVSQ